MRGAEHALQEVVDPGADARLGPQDIAVLEAVVHSVKRPGAFLRLVAAATEGWKTRGDR
jgi:hypothetical protein